MDHPILLSSCFFLMLLVLLTWVGYRLYFKTGRFVKAQLGNPVITDHLVGLPGQDAESEPSSLVTFLQQLGSKVPSSEQEVANLRSILIRAGFRSEHSMPVF